MPEFLTSENLFKLLLPLLKALLIFIVGHFIAVYATKLTVKILKKSKLDGLLVELLGKIMNIALHVLILISALSMLGVSTTGLVAALSAVAAGVALALKDSLSNIAGGIVLLASPRFAEGDIINVNGNEGKVICVDLMHTSILTYDKRRVSIPNGVLVNSEITNLTCEEIRRIDIDFPVPYGTDTGRARKVAVGIMNGCDSVLTDNADRLPYAVVDRYEESSVIIAARSWCKSEDYWRTYYDLREKLLNEMAAEGITVPFNRIDVNICGSDKE